MNNRLLTRLLLTLCCIFAFSISYAAETLEPDCPNLAGGTSFVTSNGQTYYELGNVSLDGPLGNYLSTAISKADSNTVFHPDSTVAAYATTDSVRRYCQFSEDDKYFECLPDINEPVFLFKAPDKLTNVLTLTVTSLKPGTKIMVTAKIQCLTADLDDDTHRTTYDQGVTYSYMDWYSQSLYLGVNTNPGSGHEIKLPYSSPIAEVKDTFTISQNSTTATISIMTGHNKPQACDVYAIYDLHVYGCLNPIVISSMGQNICEGEQALFTLDKEYKGSSYLWEWSADGLTWETIGTNSSALKEVTADGVVRCTMDGIQTEPLEIKAITCCVVNGKPASRKTVFNETFGYFKGEHTYVDKDGNETTTPSTDATYRTTTSFTIPDHEYDGTGQVNDGSFAVVVPTEKGYTMKDGNTATWMTGVIADHTSALDGHANGACLFINVTQNFHGPIFNSQIDGLCANKELTFETYIANLSGGANPYVSIYIKSLDGSKVYGKHENVEAVEGAGWTLVQISDILTEESSVMMEIIADCGTRCSDGSYWNKGNDLAIDDIKFMTCSPPSISIYSNLENFSQDTTICSDAIITLQAPTSELLLSYFGGSNKTMFIYQISVDGGKTWANLTGSTQENTYKFNTASYKDEKEMRVRIIVGSDDAISKFAEDPNAVVTGDDCSDYSTSDPFIVTRAGDLEMDADYKGGACKGEDVTLKGSTYESIVSWKWQDSKENDLTALFNQETDSRDFQFTLLNDTVVNFIGFSADGCKGKRQYTVTANPTAEVELTVDSLCDQTVLTATTTPEDATITWTIDGVASEETEKSLTFEAPFTAATYAATATATAEGYCVSIEQEKTFGVKETPTWSVTGPFTKDAMVGDVVDLADVVEGYDATVNYVWYGDGTATEKPATGSSTMPTINTAVEGAQTYWVSFIEDECESEAIEIDINIVSSPLPFHSDTTVCVGSDVDLTQLALITTDEYELQWYDAEEGGTASATAPTVDVSAAGVQTFYVSQKSLVSPYPESKRVAVKVTTIGVDKPLVTTPINYCKGDAATALTATAVQDKTTQMLADAFVWVSGVTESAEAPVPATTESGETTYSVYQTYAVTGVDGTLNETCKGETVDITVNVYETAAPTDATVQYIKANVGADGKTFPTIDQATTGKWAEETGYKYYYSAVSETEAKPATGYTAGVPAPVYDVSLLSGGTKELYTWVYRESEANAIACSSDTILVKIKISDALPPEAQGVYVCEDGAVPDLTATVSILEGTGKTEADYELRWYTEDPSANLAATYTPGATFSTGITAAVAGIGHKKATYEYYVTQYDLTTFAESSPTEVVVTVWPKPVLEVTDPTPTCETAIDLTKTWTSTNSTEYSSYFTASQTYADADGNPNTGTVETTGTYTVTSSYVLSGTGVTIAEASTCTSLGYPIVVQVDELSIPVITGTTSVCPNESGVQLTVASETAKPSATYTWAGSQVGNGNAINLNTFGGEKGKTYTYTATATAGVCTKTSEPHTITVGSGQIDGSMTITEADNDSLYAGVEYKNKEQIDIYTCGGEVSLVADYVKDDDSEFEWYKGTGGTYSTTAEATGTTLTIPANATYSTTAYQLRFKNKCDVVINVIVHNIPLTATAVEEDVKKCEGETFSTKVDITCGETPDIRWYRDDVEVKGATEATFTQSSLVETNHEGQYSYEVVNRGCRAKGNAANLDVQRYIRVTPKSEPYIVIRGEQADMQVDITVPESGTVGTATWTDEKGTEANEGVNYTIAAVSDNHDYTIALADDDYCSASTTVSLKVDAKLQMTATLGTVLCYGSSDTLRIDTTGTGNFYRTDIKPSLTVVRTENGVATNLEGDLRKVGNELLLTVSPSTNANYTVTFTYGEQQLVESLDIEVIPAISLTVPDVQTVCEGESVTLTVTDVAPTGTTISWTADPTITSGTDGESITAAPTYTTGTNHTSEYTYVAVAYNEFCGKSKSYDVKVKVDEPLTGSIAGDEKICEGNQSRVDASSYEATAYTWVANGDTIGTSPSMSVKPSETTTYQVLLSRGQCTAEDSHELEVASHPVIISVDSVGVRVRSISTETGRGTTPFTYWVDVETSKQSDQVFYDLKFAQHTAYIRDAVGCETSYDFSLSAPKISIPIQFTPNGDGINDTWEIGNMVDVYPTARIQIYDRYGKLLAEYQGSEDGWNGEYNGTKLPSTDYWYVINIEEIDMQYTGHFTLIRQ